MTARAARGLPAARQGGNVANDCLVYHGNEGYDGSARSAEAGDQCPFRRSPKGSVGDCPYGTFIADRLLPDRHAFAWFNLISNSHDCATRYQAGIGYNTSFLHDDRQTAAVMWSAQEDSILRKPPLRVTGMPGDQSPRKNTPNNRRGKQEPDHRRQADGRNEHGADREDEPANVAGDFHGGEVDLRRAPLRFVRSRDVGRMTIVPSVEHDREQRAGRHEDRDPDAERGTENGERRDNKRPNREACDGFGKRDSANLPCR
jgi:hypothetical protein